MSSFLIPAGTDVLAFAKQMREVLNPVRDQVDTELLVVKAAKSVLNQMVGLDPVQDAGGHLETAWKEFHLEQMAAAKKSADYDPNRFEAIFMPTSAGIIIRTFCENRRLRDSFEALDLPEEYDFYVAQEPPEHLSDEQWEARGQAFSEIKGRMNENGLSFILRSTPNIRKNRFDAEAVAGALGAISWKPGLAVADLAYRKFHQHCVETGDPRVDRHGSNAGKMFDLVIESNAGDELMQLLPELSYELLAGQELPSFDRMELNATVDRLVANML